MAQDITIPLAEAGTAEDETAERITDAAFQPTGPITAMPEAWVEATNYGLGALVSEGGKVYRSQVAGNKAHKPSEDADFANWTPVPFSFVPLVNPNYNHALTAGAGLGQ